jgi:hypothetical protein
LNFSLSSLLRMSEILKKNTRLLTKVWFSPSSLRRRGRWLERLFI